MEMKQIVLLVFIATYHLFVKKESLEEAVSKLKGEKRGNSLHIQTLPKSQKRFLNNIVSIQNK